jgi:hypothetical protein
MRPNRIVVTFFLLEAIFLSACSAAITRDDSTQVGGAPSAAEINAAAKQAETENPASPIPSETKTTGSALPGPTAAPVTESTSGANPQINRRVNVPENLRVNWLLPWDAIRPVYDPEFTTAEDAPLDDEELVIGLSLEGDAKAYPITVLRFREMVNDEMAGIPTLVTW